MIDAHPLAGSFGSALATSYAAGASEAGHDVRLVALRDLAFAPNAPHDALEPDLILAQADLKWCQHLAVIYPNWWGTYPALFKAFIDRILTQGFAFQTEGKSWKGLLAGRSAQVVTTMDTPFWIYRWILGAPGVRAVAWATFGFCAIKPTFVKLLGPIHSSTLAQREAWLDEVFRMGRSVDGLLRTSPAARFKAWLTVARLQFYPFPILVLATGALAASDSLNHPIQAVPLLLAAACGFLLEFSTVLTNELEDLETDRQNRNAGRFTGGSRVLVEGWLSENQVKMGRRAAGVLLIILGVALVCTANSNPLLLSILILIGWLLGHQYSAGPLRLSYRTLGEVDVAFTHSILVAGLGWASQGASWHAGFPWGSTSAIFTSVLPSIILAGVPDQEADRLSGKVTTVVRWGVRTATRLAIVATGVSLFLKFLTTSHGPFSIAINIMATLHGLALVIALMRAGRRTEHGKIDGPLILALTFMVWFALEPFLALWAGMPH